MRFRCWKEPQGLVGKIWGKIAKKELGLWREASGGPGQELGWVSAFLSQGEQSSPPKLKSH